MRQRAYLWQPVYAYMHKPSKHGCDVMMQGWQDVLRRLTGVQHATSLPPLVTRLKDELLTWKQAAEAY